MTDPTPERLPLLAAIYHAAWHALDESSDGECSYETGEPAIAVDRARYDGLAAAIDAFEAAFPHMAHGEEGWGEAILAEAPPPAPETDVAGLVPRARDLVDRSDESLRKYGTVVETTLIHAVRTLATKVEAQAREIERLRQRCEDEAVEGAQAEAQVEALQRENATLREALQPFATMADWIEKAIQRYAGDLSAPENWGKTCEWEDLRRARAALTSAVLNK